MKTIILNNKDYTYSSKKELSAIIEKHPNINFLGRYEIGNYFTAGNYFKAGDNFKAGNYFTAGYNFTAGNYFTAGDYFKAGDNFKVKNHIIIPNAYKYIARCYYEKNSKQWYVQLGCFLRTLSEWENDFWNNKNEFPNDKSKNSTKRLRVYNLLKVIIKELD